MRAGSRGPVSVDHVNLDSLVGACSVLRPGDLLWSREWPVPEERSRHRLDRGQHAGFLELTDVGYGAIEARSASVIVPVRNGATTIGAQLAAIERASRLAEGVAITVIVVDNGSTDATPTIVDSFASVLQLVFVDAPDLVGAAAVRNCGARSATSDWLLFCDADDEVDEHWIVAHIGHLAQGAEFVGGPLDYERLNSSAAIAARGAPRAGVGTTLGYLPFAHSSNMSMTREAFERLGGFDPRMHPAGEDVELSWRAQLAGIGLTTADDAIVDYRLRSSLADIWRQAVAYGRAEVALQRRFVAHGLREEVASETARDLWWIVSRAPGLTRPLRRGAWLRRVGRRWGRTAAALAGRAGGPQV